MAVGHCALHTDGYRHVELDRAARARGRSKTTGEIARGRSGVRTPAVRLRSPFGN